MEISSVLEQIQQQASNVAPIGATIKFLLDDMPIFIDGSGSTNLISSENKEADCTIISNVETLIKLKNGDLNPMMAVMSGKIKIKGDMSLATKLQSLI